MRISQPTSSLPVIQRGKQIVVQINGQPVNAFEGETIATVLLAEGRRIFRHTLKSGAPRGFFAWAGLPGHRRWWTHVRLCHPDG
jgi:hypothetical protein